MLSRLSSVPPFPEVPVVLARLAQPYRPAPISNTDDDFLSGSIAQLGSAFSTTVTAQQSQAHEPNPGLFLYALRKLQAESADIVHVAQGTFSDLAVCTALGIRVIWVKRMAWKLQNGLKPIAVISDLSSLPDVLRSL